ncbi:DUF4145 domain-containing protein [Salinicoccus kekensis]|uniref:Uncharacterized protein DUF4145 n=1 Tax=Salinicoccus kekensis TaxID=714307 RepID=A0A285USD2_9STAP|nr:DUF4145 domain-containing protein [Salinicoccus kekensis]SOC43606.1 uncharacterized protein DUF4145 [Salinicoccus kekensis]
MKLKCPFCDHAVAETPDTFRQNYINFYDAIDTLYTIHGTREESDYDIRINKLRCSHCDRTSYDVGGVHGEYTHIQLPIHPLSKAKQLPEYIPAVLREDYEEAYRIVHLSPKASATLSRRCLQGMIRDFFEISKTSLHDEIKAIEGLISEDQNSVLHSLRKIGNVGAHLEKDVNLILDVTVEDAGKLLLVLEYFFKEWYVSKHETQELFSDIEAIDKDLQERRKG